MNILILFGLLFLLILINVPISVSLGLASIFYMLIYDISLSSVTSIIFSSMNKFTLLAIPFFILAGVVMQESGISKRLINLATKIVGPIPGGLGVVTVVVAIFFAAISGSGPATVAAIGAILIPAMVKQGYPKPFSSALIATSGSLGIVIPPSIALVVYGMLAEVSIGDLFVGGVIPGLVMGLALIIVTVFISKRNGYKGTESRDTKGILKALLSASWGILSPVIVLGGIYIGIFTPTEAAAVAAVYGIFVGFFIYKELNIKSFVLTLRESAVVNANVMFIIANAGLFAWILTREGIATDIANFILNYVSGPLTFLLIVNIIFLFAGMFIDATSAFYILLPIILPVVHAMGVDPLALGVILTLNLAIGQITPPVGINLYVASNLSDTPVADIVRATIPLLIASLLVLALVSILPQTITFLPYLGK